MQKNGVSINEGPRQIGSNRRNFLDPMIRQGINMDRRNWGGRIEIALPTFEIQLKRKRSSWNWLVCTHDGRPMMLGSAVTRAKASYLANRALFLLLSTAHTKAGLPDKNPSRRKFRTR